MKLLLDTCTFLWILEDSSSLSKEARQLFLSNENEVFLSSVSAWEISVKHQLGKLPLPEPPYRFIPAQRERHGITPLELSEDAALHLSRIPDFHKDPFDRMLVCQALVHGMSILTPDEWISQYPAPVIW